MISGGSLKPVESLEVEVSGVPGVAIAEGGGKREAGVDGEIGRDIGAPPEGLDF